MIRWLLNNDLESIWKKVVFTLFKGMQEKPVSSEGPGFEIWNQNLQNTKQ